MSMFQRSSGTRHYRKLFLISSEGHVTEPSYFARFNSSDLRVECLSENGKSAPLQVLHRLKKAMDKRRLQSGDQVWLVIDRDEWPEEDIRALADWVKEAGASCIELQAVKDEMHEKYYGKAGYNDAKNFVMKVKWF